jgi:predicted RNA-binding protein YlxR (DUF448 family)
MLPIKQFYLSAKSKLSEDFPALTDKQQTKIIDRYISAVTDEVNSSLRKFASDNGCYTVNLKKIQVASRSTINKKQQYVHSWFENNCPLFAVVYKGNGIHKKLTEIKMYYDIKIKIDLLYIDAVNDKIDDIREAIKFLYTKEHFSVFEEGDETKFDLVPINMKTLKKYIEASEKTKHNYNVNVIDNRIREAKRIYIIAKCFEGNLIQIIKESEFGRKYYVGPNLQSIHKDIRHAALGDCIEYDIENSVYAWRYTEAKRIAQEYSIDIKLPHTLDYLDRKAYWRETLAEHTFQNTALSPEKKISIIKQVFTAISFGARGTQKSVFWIDGNNAKTYAVNELIKNQNDRQNFFTHPFVKEFLIEQKQISDIIYTYYTELNDFSNCEFLKVKGNLSRNKIMSYLYQQQERHLLDTVTSHFEKDNLLLTVHDAFYIKKPDTQAIHNAKFDLKQYNQELNLEKSVPNSKWGAIDMTDEMAHKHMIAQQEALAMGYENRYNKV